MVPRRYRRQGRPATRSGAGLLLFLAAHLAGCGHESSDPPDPELEAARELGLREGARVHRVTLGGRGSEEHAVPRVVEAAPGDAVEFLTVDHRVHRVIFPADSLDQGPREFLERTGQAESPPLAFRGSRFLLGLQEAPPGRYPFLSQGHGGITGGVVQVGPLPDTFPPPSLP